MAFVLWRKEDKNLVTSVGNLAVGYAVIALIAGVIGGSITMYKGLDSYGWLSHSEDTVITAQGNWIVGETKDCKSYPIDAALAKESGKEVGYAMYRVVCDDGPEHQVRVRFYGRTSQPEYGVVGWRCIRNIYSFTCEETVSVRSDHLENR
jgi:hypothetical protein